MQTIRVKMSRECTLTVNYNPKYKEAISQDADRDTHFLVVMPETLKKLYPKMGLVVTPYNTHTFMNP